MAEGQGGVRAGWKRHQYATGPAVARSGTRDAASTVRP